MKCVLNFDTEAFQFVMQIEMWNCSHSAPEVRPGRHPVPAAVGSSQLSRFWWGAPLQANSPGEAGSAEPSRSPAAVGHDRAWEEGTTSQLTQHQPYLKVRATKLRCLHLERDGCRTISFVKRPFGWLRQLYGFKASERGCKISRKTKPRFALRSASQVRALTPRAVRWDPGIVRKISNKANEKEAIHNQFEQSLLNKCKNIFNYELTATLTQAQQHGLTTLFFCLFQ